MNTDKTSIENKNQPVVVPSLPIEVIELLKRAGSFIPLYMPTQAHNEHNMLKLDILKCLDKYGAGNGHNCSFCKHFKKDVEYADLGMCQNEQVTSKLLFSHCDSFLIHADFGCKWFSKNDR